MASIIAPLIKKGQSPYTIVTNHPELGISEKTLYNYIEGGIFEFSGSNRLISLDLRRQASRKISKKVSAQYKKRVDRKFLKGREYQRAFYPDIQVCEARYPFMHLPRR